MKIIGWLSIAIISFSTNIYGQNFPSPEYPYTLVNDYSKILTIDEFDALEIKLETLFEETSIRIMVITVDDLNGLGISDYSTGITDQWNASLKTTSKQILIMIKPKTAKAKMEVLITAGSDMKDYIPDHVAREIVANEIMPEFRRSKYFSGLFSGTDVIEALAKKELTWEDYLKNNSGISSKSISDYALRVVLVLVIVFLTGRIILKSRQPLKK